jgi:oxygen-dependent protoporphyrinogen oxidase
MQLLTDKLVERISSFESQNSNLKSEASNFGTEIDNGLPSPQTSIRLNTPIDSLTLDTDAVAGGDPPMWRVGTRDQETLLADAICLAVPSHVAGSLLRNIDNELASALEAITYASSATVNLAYKRGDISHPLDGFGFVVPFIERRSLMACTFSSVKFAGRAPEDHALLRGFVGGALQPEMLDLTDSELTSRVRADLRDLLGIQQAPLFVKISRWERSMPQYHIGHVERVNTIRQRLSSLPNLALAGGAYEGVGIPDCIRSGETAADELLDVLAAKS